MRLRRMERLWLRLWDGRWCGRGLRRRRLGRPQGLAALADPVGRAERLEDGEGVFEGFDIDRLGGDGRQENGLGQVEPLRIGLRMRQQRLHALEQAQFIGGIVGREFLQQLGHLQQDLRVGRIAFVRLLQDAEGLVEPAGPLLAVIEAELVVGLGEDEPGFAEPAVALRGVGFDGSGRGLRPDGSPGRDLLLQDLQQTFELDVQDRLGEFDGIEGRKPSKGKRQVLRLGNGRSVQQELDDRDLPLQGRRDLQPHEVVLAVQPTPAVRKGTGHPLGIDEDQHHLRLVQVLLDDLLEVGARVDRVPVEENVILAEVGLEQRQQG